MTTPLEISVNQRNLLGILLKIKKANKDSTVHELQKAIIDIVGIMDEKDVAYIEKVHGIKAL